MHQFWHYETSSSRLFEVLGRGFDGARKTGGPMVLKMSARGHQRVTVMCFALGFFILSSFMVLDPGTAWCSEDEIIVGVSTGYPPYYYEEEGRLTGICIEIVDAVASSLNMKVTYNQYPWKRLMANAENGVIDGAMPLFRTKERDTFLYMDGLELVDEENSFFTWKNSSVRYDGSLESIRQFSIGVVAGYSYGEEFDRIEGLKKVVTENDEHLVEMFRHHRFDLGVGSRDVTLYNTKRKGIADQIKFLKPSLTRKPLHIGFTRKGNNREIAQQFAAGLKEFKETEKYKRLLIKYDMD